MHSSRSPGTASACRKRATTTFKASTLPDASPSSCQAAPSTLSGPLLAHASSVRWAALHRAGAIGLVTILRTSDIPWERTKLRRLTPVKALVEDPLGENNTAARSDGEPRRRRGMVQRLRPHRGRDPVAGGGTEAAPPLRAVRSAAGDARHVSDSAAIGQRDRDSARHGPPAGRRARGAQRTPRSHRARRTGERRRHLQRRHGQRVGHGHAPRGRAAAARIWRPPAAIARVPLGDRRGARAARLPLLHRASHRASLVHRGRPQHGHVPAPLSDAVADRERARGVGPRRRSPARRPGDRDRRRRRSRAGTERIRPERPGTASSVAESRPSLSRSAGRSGRRSTRSSSGGETSAITRRPTTSTSRWISRRPTTSRASTQPWSRRLPTATSARAGTTPAFSSVTPLNERSG